jgi:glycerol-3-phosphate dehydrogenase
MLSSGRGGTSLKRDLGALTEREHDLVIVGGGIHGVAAAWDAASRGLRAALVEADDFGSGTSWNSLKTIHGGLRYLQTLDLKRMRESIRERRALLRIAPVLVRPLPFVVPTYGHGPKGREALSLGLWLNDLVSSDRNRGLPAEQRIPNGRLLSRREVLDLFPGVSEDGLNGGASWTDAQVESSERLTIGFARAAADAGAVLCNHLAAVAFLRRGAAVTGIRGRDGLGGGEIDIRGRIVLNAAGPGMDGVLALAGIGRPTTPLLRAMNLVLTRNLVAGHALGASSGGRFLFLVPWRDRSIVGTAYGPGETPEPGDIPAFLEEVRRAYPWASLGAGDVSLVHRGRVPGRGGAGGLATRHQLLDHEALDGVPGLVSVQGVKYTTARGVAEEAVDLVLRRLRRPPTPSRTDAVPLDHARPLEGTLDERSRVAVREEMALTLGDAILRRLDLGTAGRPVAPDVDAVEGVLAEELGWSADRRAAERRALEEAYVNSGAQSG